VSTSRGLAYAGAPPKGVGAHAVWVNYLLLEAYVCMFDDEPLTLDHMVVTNSGDMASIDQHGARADYVVNKHIGTDESVTPFGWYDEEVFISAVISIEPKKDGIEITEGMMLLEIYRVPSSKLPNDWNNTIEDSQDWDKVRLKRHRDVTTIVKEEKRGTRIDELQLTITDPETSKEYSFACSANPSGA